MFWRQAVCNLSVAFKFSPLKRKASPSSRLLFLSLKSTPRGFLKQLTIKHSKEQRSIENTFRFKLPGLLLIYLNQHWELLPRLLWPFICSTFFSSKWSTSGMPNCFLECFNLFFVISSKYSLSYQRIIFLFKCVFCIRNRTMFMSLVGVCQKLVQTELVLWDLNHSVAHQRTCSSKGFAVQIGIGNSQWFGWVYLCLWAFGRGILNAVCSKFWEWELLKHEQLCLWLFSGPNSVSTVLPPELWCQTHGLVTRLALSAIFWFWTLSLLFSFYFYNINTFPCNKYIQCAFTQFSFEF